MKQTWYEQRRLVNIEIVNFFVSQIFAIFLLEYALENHKVNPQ